MADKVAQIWGLLQGLGFFPVIFIPSTPHIFYSSATDAIKY
jgi:hypothetical protein